MDTSTDSDGDDDMVTDTEPFDNYENRKLQEESLRNFAAPDFIMEPTIYSTLSRYFQAGGSPEMVVELLSENYAGIAQMANLVAEWILLLGTDISEVQETIEQHLKNIIKKNFDSKKADSIFSDAGEPPSWLQEMIEHPTWRALFYQLAEDFPECLMLNFTIKSISDAGFQGEITSVTTASQQIEVFSRVFKTTVTALLEGGDDFMTGPQLANFTKMVCHSEHTYLYSMVVLHLLAQEPMGGAIVKRLMQEVQKQARDSGIDVTPIAMTLSGAAAYPVAYSALASMLTKKALNPADISKLYSLYNNPASSSSSSSAASSKGVGGAADPPPVELIRNPQFLELLVDALFVPGSRINPDHKPKYVFLLAYASSVAETYKKSQRKGVNKDELKLTVDAVEKVHEICRENKGSSELIADVGTLYRCIRFPVVAVGVLRWVDYTVSDSSYFNLTTEHTPLHLALIDEIAECHPLLHQRILQLLVRLFEKPLPELEILVQLELKKTLLDRMVHLLSKGCVVPVMTYIKKCWEHQDTDVSLIRHFVTEVLDMISPPYTAEFVSLFLPFIENKDITGSLRNEEIQAVSEFIKHCKY